MLGTASMDEVMPVEVADLIGRQRKEIERLNFLVAMLEDDARRTKTILTKINGALARMAK